MFYKFIVKIVMSIQTFFFRLTNGKLFSEMRGMPILLLNTKGRKTGKIRTTPVMYIRNREDYIVTASNNGLKKHPGWLYNIKASPEVEIEVPGKKLNVKAKLANDSERKEYWQDLISRASFFESYKKTAERTIHMVVLHPEN